MSESPSLPRSLSSEENISPLKFAYMAAQPLIFVNLNTQPVYKRPMVLLDTTKERELIKESILKAQKGGKYIEFNDYVGTAKNFQNNVLNGNNDIVHISCHGHDGTLWLEDELGRAHKNEEDNIKKELKLRKGVKLIFVSACHSERLGQLFASEGIDHVIAIEKEDEVNDAAAIVFCKEFYTQIFNNKDVESCFNCAKFAVESDCCIENAKDEAKKFILLGKCGTDTFFFPTPDKKSRRTSNIIQTGRPPEWLDRDPEYFFGRSLELQCIHETFARNDVNFCRCMNIYGCSGIGKTELCFKFAEYERYRLFTSDQFYVTFGRDSLQLQKMNVKLNYVDLLAKSLKLGDINSEDHLFEAIKSKLSKDFAPKKLLIIDDWQNINAFLPEISMFDDAQDIITRLLTNKNLFLIVCSINTMEISDCRMVTNYELKGMRPLGSIDHKDPTWKEIVKICSRGNMSEIEKRILYEFITVGVDMGKPTGTVTLESTYFYPKLLFDLHSTLKKKGLTPLSKMNLIKIVGAVKEYHDKILATNGKTLIRSYSSTSPKRKGSLTLERSKSVVFPPTANLLEESRAQASSVPDVLGEKPLDTKGDEPAYLNNNSSFVNSDNVAVTFGQTFECCATEIPNYGGGDIPLTPEQIFYCFRKMNECRCGYCLKYTNGICGPCGCPCMSCKVLLYYSYGWTIEKPVEPIIDYTAIYYETYLGICKPTFDPSSAKEGFRIWLQGIQTSKGNYARFEDSYLPIKYCKALLIQFWGNALPSTRILTEDDLKYMFEKLENSVESYITLKDFSQQVWPQFWEAFDLAYNIFLTPLDYWTHSNVYYFVSGNDAEQYFDHYSKPNMGLFVVRFKSSFTCTSCEDQKKLVEAKVHNYWEFHRGHFVLVFRDTVPKKFKKFCFAVLSDPRGSIKICDIISGQIFPSFEKVISVYTNIFV